MIQLSFVVWHLKSQKMKTSDANRVMSAPQTSSASSPSSSHGGERINMDQEYSRLIQCPRKNNAHGMSHAVSAGEISPTPQSPMVCNMTSVSTLPPSGYAEIKVSDAEPKYIHAAKRRYAKMTEKTPSRTPKPPRRKTDKELFLELAKPNEEGFSRPVHVDEFVGEYQSLAFKNGCPWGRDDGPLGNEYNIERVRVGGRVESILLHGFNKNPVKRSIPAWIKRKIKRLRCVVLGTGNPEADHKDGRYDDRRAQDFSTASLDDFQPLSKAANMAKRSHCKKCRKTGIRFDARSIGFQVGYLHGGAKYRGSCVGCFWHNVAEFHKVVSAPRSDDAGAPVENDDDNATSYLEDAGRPFKDDNATPSPQVAFDFLEDQE